MTPIHRSDVATPHEVWLALALPPCAWAAHEMASFYVAFELCRQGRAPLARAALGLVSLGALLLAIAGLTAGLRAWRRRRPAAALPASDGRARIDLLAMMSVLVGVVFTLALLWGALPSLLLRQVCEARE